MNMNDGVSASIKKIEAEAKSVKYIRPNKELQFWTDEDYVYESIYKGLNEDYITYRTFHYFSKEFPLTKIVYKRILKSYMKTMIVRASNGDTSTNRLDLSI